MLTQDILHELFEYRDGVLYNRFSRGPRAIKGAPAGGINPSTGYMRVAINGRIYQISRLIYTMHHGVIPEGMQIDHINGEKLDNRVENLRVATPTQNEWNKQRVGVRFESGKWRAKFTYQNKQYHIGMFDTREKAETAYLKTVSKYRQEFIRGVAA